MQFVLPVAEWEHAIKCCHDDMRHLGLERMMDLLRDRFYWPFMEQQAEKHIKTCSRCLQFKQKPHQAQMVPIQATHPLELIHIDYLKIEHGKDNSKSVDILVITDHFTRYSQALPGIKQQK